MPQPRRRGQVERAVTLPGQPWQRLLEPREIIVAQEGVGDDQLIEFGVGKHPGELGGLIERTQRPRDGADPCGGEHGDDELGRRRGKDRSEEHTSELQSLMRISYAVFCLKKKKTIKE